MKYGPDFWNTTWSRNYERYNRHHQAIWQAVVPFLVGKVVDLGCGPAVLYEGKDIDLTGVDFSAAGLEQAKLHYPQGRFVQADVRHTGLPDQAFDTCVIFGLLDYFEDWEEVLQEARRITRGNIVATLLHGFEGHDWKKYPKIVGDWHLYTVTKT